MGGGNEDNLETRIREAAARFRSISFSALRPSHLANSHLTPAERFEFIGARQSATPSQVDAFVSHSWSDDWDAKCASNQLPPLARMNSACWSPLTAASPRPDITLASGMLPLKNGPSASRADTGAAQGSGSTRRASIAMTSMPPSPTCPSMCVARPRDPAHGGPLLAIFTLLRRTHIAGPQIRALSAYTLPALIL